MDNPPRHVVRADPGMAAALAPRLSADHVREIREVTGLPPSDALLLSCRASVEAYAFIPPGRTVPVFMMGVEEPGRLTGTALVWMLGSADAARHGAGVVRAGRWGVRRAFLATGAERLEQYIPEWYAAGLRFARRLGFSLSHGRLRGRGGGELCFVAARRGDFLFPLTDRKIHPSRHDDSLSKLQSIKEEEHGRGDSGF